MSGDLRLNVDVVFGAAEIIRSESGDFWKKLSELTEFVEGVLSVWSGRGADFYRQAWKDFHTAAQDIAVSVVGLADGVTAAGMGIVVRDAGSADNIDTGFTVVDDMGDGDVRW